MSDQVVRFLNALRVVAFDDQRKIAERFHAAAVAAEQANHADSLLPRLLASRNYVRRSARVEIARQTSPFAPSASICRPKTFSNPVSLAMHVSTPPSVVKAIAGSARRFSKNRLTSSPAICCASAAEPPLPNTRSLPPALKAAVIISAARSTAPVCASKKRRFV